MQRFAWDNRNTARRALRRPEGADWFAVGPGGRYLGMEPLRPGGASAPYRGWDRRLHRLVVLKVLPQDAPGDGWQARHLRREGEAAASFAHPALARLLDRGEADGRPFLVYEYFPGGSLADAFRAGSLPLSKFLEVLTEAASGLAYLHRLDWVHGDVKPANVLFDEAGRPRLADFGLTRRVGEDSREGTQVIASAPYAAPEQRAGLPLAPAADVYSLSAVLHEGLTGRRWTGRCAADLLDLPVPALKAVLSRGLAADWDERYPDAAALREALRECAAAELPQVPAGRAARPSRADVPTLPRVTGGRPTAPGAPLRPAGSPLLAAAQRQVVSSITPTIKQSKGTRN